MSILPSYEHGSGPGSKPEFECMQGDGRCQPMPFFDLSGQVRLGTRRRFQDLTKSGLGALCSVRNSRTDSWRAGFGALFHGSAATESGAAPEYRPPNPRKLVSDIDRSFQPRTQYTIHPPAWTKSEFAKLSGNEWKDSGLAIFCKGCERDPGRGPPRLFSGANLSTNLPTENRAS